jgi:hypothetical protein
MTLFSHCAANELGKTSTAISPAPQQHLFAILLLTHYPRETIAKIWSPWFGLATAIISQTRS